MVVRTVDLCEECNESIKSVTCEVCGTVVCKHCAHTLFIVKLQHPVRRDPDDEMYSEFRNRQEEQNVCLPCCSDCWNFHGVTTTTERFKERIVEAIQQEAKIHFRQEKQ